MSALSDSEFRLLVFNAAKDGKLKKLKALLSSKSPVDIKESVSSKTNGSTPLIAASRNGKTDMVGYLITKCKADMEQCGSVTFDGETIEGAPPLWCAAAAGHLPVVKCLVQHKANSNSTTMTNSTPLRAACFDGHLGIVKYLLEYKADVEIANRHGHTCLMIACYKGHKEIVKTLLEIGADVNRRSAKGNTALHDCAESGSLEIIKLLLKHGARMQKDGYGMTPLLAAAITGHRQVVEYLVLRPQTSLEEHIHALELLGATFVDKRQERTTAYNLWLRAIQLRYRGAVFADAGDFHRCIALWMYALDMQQGNLDPLSPMTLSSLLSFAELFSFMQKDQVHMRIQVPKATHSQILEVLKRAFNEIKQGASTTLKVSTKSKDNTIRSSIPGKDQDKPTSNSVESSHDRFQNDNSRSRNSGGSSPHQGAHHEDAQGTTQQCCGVCEASGQRMFRAMGIALHLLALSNMVEDAGPDEESESELREKARLLYSMREVVDHNKRTLLHLASGSDACPLGRYPVTTFPSADVVRTLLRCGFDPNARDNDGNNPIHIACSAAKSVSDKCAQGQECSKMSARILGVITALVEKHGHVDYRNCAGCIPSEILPGYMRREVNFAKHESLKCLAARAVVVHNLRFEDHMPKSEWKFVSSH